MVTGTRERGTGDTRVAGEAAVPAPGGVTVPPGARSGSPRDTLRMRSSGPAPFRVLFVCTGNICRSALAEHLGRAYLQRELEAGADQVQLGSAGTGAVVGSGIHPDTALVLAGFGGDARGHEARQLTERMVLDADLTLTMTRAHRKAVLRTAPRALSRVFTLREAAALVGSLDPDRDLPGEDLAARARGLVREMAAARPQRVSGPEDDVADPIGRSLEVQQESGDLVAEALLVVLARVAALDRAPGSRDARAG
jgi:protein-tyrosine-phosphatase